MHSVASNTAGLSQRSRGSSTSTTCSLLTVVLCCLIGFSLIAKTVNTHSITKTLDGKIYDSLIIEQGVVREVANEGESIELLTTASNFSSLASEKSFSSDSQKARFLSPKPSIIIGGNSFSIKPEADTLSLRDPNQFEKDFGDNTIFGGFEDAPKFATRLQNMAAVLENREIAETSKLMMQPLLPPCRRVFLPRQSLVDTKPRGTRAPAHGIKRCRITHDDHPTIALALLIEKSAEIVNTIRRLQKLAAEIKGSNNGTRKAEVLVLVDGQWPGEKTLLNAHKLMEGENDWFLISKNKLGEMKQFNKLTRCSQAEVVVWLSVDDLPPENVTNSEQRNWIEWITSAIKIIQSDKSIALVTPQNKELHDEAMRYSMSVKLAPFVVRRESVIKLGGIEEWGGCRGEKITREVGTELSQRLWRGGFKAILLVSSTDFLGRPLPLASTNQSVGGYIADIDSEWPFVLPGRTKKDISEAREALISEASRTKEVVGNCASPGLDDSGIYHGATKSCQGEIQSYPIVSIVMQYFRRPKIIIPLLNSLVRLKFQVEFIINDDSISELSEFTRYSSRGPGNYDWVLALFNNVHEIRGYNRLGMFASSELVMLIQDDDAAPKDDSWVRNALYFFNKYPTLGILGGYRGRIDNGRKQMADLKQNNGQKFGADWKRDRMKLTQALTTLDPGINKPFMWMYKVNLAPLIVRRSLFTEVGGFNTNFSCAGNPGIGLDYEISIRLWKLGWRVGLYDPKFHHAIGNSKQSGTHSGPQKKIRDASEGQNNMLMYRMYPNFHHKVGSSIVMKSNQQGIKSGSFRKIKGR
jgi:GT2 family glycosyltransferase|tara:strand:- start:163 stop:2589 length:2427 start_codon:yes stop_codon:yes gene_type:complete